MPDSPPPLRPPVRSGQAPLRGPDRRPGPGRRAGDAQGDRVHRRGPRQAARRRRRRRWIETMPCNYNQRRLAEHVKDGHPGGRRDADGVQHDLGQRRRVDGHRGDEGVARQPRGRRRLDRARRRAATCSTASSASSAATRRCPARRWPSAGSTSRASSSTTARSIPGVVQGPAQRDRRDASTRRSAPTGRARSRSTSCTRSRTRRARAPGACGGQFTANTMSMVLEFLGLSPAGLNGIPAEDPAKDEAARRCGELVMDLVRDDIRPSRVRHRGRSIDNAIAVGRRDRRLDQRRPPPARDRPRVRDPARHRRVRGDRRPDADRRRHAAGRPLHRDATCTRRAASALVMRELLQARPARRRRRRNVDGRTIAEIAAGADRDRRARRSSSRSSDRSSRPAAWRSCAARSRRTAAS